MMKVICNDRRPALDPHTANKQLVLRVSSMIAWSQIKHNTTSTYEVDPVVQAARDLARERSRLRKISRKLGLDEGEIALRRSIAQSAMTTNTCEYDMVETSLYPPSLLHCEQDDEYDSESSSDSDVSDTASEVFDGYQAISYLEDIESQAEAQESTLEVPSTPAAASSKKRPPARPPAVAPTKRTSKTCSRISLEPNVQLDVCSESNQLIYAFFSNLPLRWKVDWKSILGESYGNFEEFEQLPSDVCQIWSFSLSEKGNRRYRNSRKSAIQGVGGQLISLTDIIKNDATM